MEIDHRPLLGTLSPVIQAQFGQRFSDRIIIQRSDLRYIRRGHKELTNEEWQIVESILNPLEIRRDRVRPEQRVVYYGRFVGRVETPYLKTIIIIRSYQSGMDNTIRTAYPVSSKEFLKWRNAEGRGEEVIAEEMKGEM